MAINMFSRSSYSMGLSGMLYNLTGSGKSNMAASIPEVPIFVLVDKIGTTLQDLVGNGYWSRHQQMYDDMLPTWFVNDSDLVVKLRRQLILLKFSGLSFLRTLFKLL